MHRSVVHGFRMTGANIKFIVPEFRTDFGVFDPISFEKLKAELDKDGKINVVALTSPTYDGLAADIQRIAKLCQNRNIRLLIDGAHGSLFPFHKELFPESGIGIQGVDIVV